jgi:hypothetical protein
MDDELDGVMALSSIAVPRTIQESSALATTMRSPCLTMDSWCSRSVPRPSGGCAGSCRTQRRMGHVGLLPEVELAVAKLLLVVDERHQRDRFVLVVFVWGLQVRNIDSSFTLIYENDL